MSCFIQGDRTFDLKIHAVVVWGGGNLYNLDEMEREMIFHKTMKKNFFQLIQYLRKVPSLNCGNFCRTTLLLFFNFFFQFLQHFLRVFIIFLLISLIFFQLYPWFEHGSGLSLVVIFDFFKFLQDIHKPGRFLNWNLKCTKVWEPLIFVYICKRTYKHRRVTFSIIFDGHS